jgi:ABC-type cobalamin/Fe3+-siderophores transport system ATPase subunit
VLIQNHAGSRHARPRRSRLRQVSFAYGPDRTVLKDISLHARPGQMLAIVGPTGAGKSTLVNLIPAFHEPTHGRILIDGQDLQGLTLEPPSEIRSPSSARNRSSSTAPSARTSSTAGSTPHPVNSRPPPGPPIVTTSSRAPPVATIHSSANAASNSASAKNNASASPARSSKTARS